MAIDKIRRSITWIRKALQITEKTTNPGTVDGNIVPTIDTFGWEELEDPTVLRTIGVAVNTIASAVVPADVLRVVLGASVQTNDTVQAFTMWIEHVDAETALAVSVMRPADLPISAVTIRVGLPRVVIMRPGDFLRGRSSPATGVGLDLRLTVRSVDLPIGEYIRGL